MLSWLRSLARILEPGACHRIDAFEALFRKHQVVSQRKRRVFFLGNVFGHVFCVCFAVCFLDTGPSISYVLGKPYTLSPKP